mgnify:CR=1 FL=1
MDELKESVNELRTMFGSLAEKIDKISLPPGQPDPIIPATVDKDNDHLINDKDLSSVRNRKLETSQTMENTQFDKNTSADNLGKAVSIPSIISDSDPAITRKPSVKIKLKKFKKRKSALKKNMEPIEENIIIKGAVNCTLSFISGLLNLLNAIFNKSPAGIIGMNK